jgi:hypothetical protein
VGLRINRREKARPFMATSRYDVEYEDGRKRVKLLTAEHAQQIGEQKGVKNVKRAASNKSRTPEGDK